MIKYVKFIPNATAEIRFDSYIHLTIDWNIKNATGNNNFYWRTGDFHSSLLEICIESNVGVISSITLTLINALKCISGDPFFNIPSENGLPVFDILSWGSDIFKDESGEIQLFLAKKRFIHYFI